jgi:hypothetical protein
MNAHRGQRKAAARAAGLVVDQVGDPAGCQKAIASLMDEYERYLESEHAICPACPVVRTGPVIVRSMRELELMDCDSQCGRVGAGLMRL